MSEIANGREVEILTVGRADIFDLLDENAIRAACSERFPGHDLALAAFRRAGGGKLTVLLVEARLRLLHSGQRGDDATSA